MTDPAQRQLARIQQHLDHARKVLGSSERVACNEARIATEGMLQLLADTHGVELREGGRRDKPPTLEGMKSKLRHATLLDEKMEGLVFQVQRIGNRAVHYQPDQELDVEHQEARWAVEAAEALLPLVRARLGLRTPTLAGPAYDDAVVDEPDASTPDDAPRRGWVGVLGVLVAVPAIAALAFAITLQALELTLGAGPVPEPADAPLAMPRVEGLLDEPTPTAAPAEPADEPAPTPPPELVEEAESASPERQAAATVRLRRPLTNELLAPLDCDAMQRVRSWIWASHGYHFDDPAEAAWFGAQEGYRDRGLGHAEVFKRFKDADKANLDALNGRMKALACACPKPLAPKRPCPG